MKVNTRFGGSGAWKDWNISDDMSAVSAELKAAALFTCIYSGAVRIRR
ncbi:MAG: hypothetical protein AB2L26_12680 [Ignavibacteria bacterium]